MGSNTITICSSFLIFVLLTSVFAFSASQNNGFLAFADDGDITVPVLAELEFEPEHDSDAGDIQPYITQVSGDIFAIVYDGDSGHSSEGHCDGCLKTVRIDSDGTITVIDTFDFADEADEPYIIRVSDNVVAIVFDNDGSPDDGVLRTVGIDNDGMITGVIASLEFETSVANVPIITQVTGDIFAIVYDNDGSPDEGILKTVGIDSDGTIDGVISTLEFEDSDADDPYIIRVSKDVVAIVYFEDTGCGESTPCKGILKTVGIDSGGDIDGVIATLEFEDDHVDDNDPFRPYITQVSGDIFAIVYDGDSGHSSEGHCEGCLKTVRIDSDGDIDGVIASFEFDNDPDELDADDPHIIRVSKDVVAIVYDGDESSCGDGCLTTVGIDSDGTIDGVIATLEFETSNADVPYIGCVKKGVFAIVYEGPSDDGFIVTVGIEGSSCQVTGAGGGSDASEYLSKPTFGLDHKTQVVQVQGGFTANGKVFDVTDNWHTDFERQAILVGQTNTFSAKAHADHVINVVEFMFGIPEVGFAHLAEASIEVTIDRNQQVTNVQVNQNGNLIDPSSVTASAVMAQCKSGDTDKKCYFITVSGIFNEALMNDIFALKGIDFLRHFHLTYLNEGFTIFGNSINPATTLLIASNVKGSTGLMEVIQIDKEYDMWVDKSGIEYERNSFGTFLRMTPVEVVRDDPMVKVMTRMNSNFETMKQNELDKATAIFDSSLIQKELPDSFRIADSERINKLQDPEVQLKLFIERMRADDKMNQLLQMWYAKPNPNLLN